MTLQASKLLQFQDNGVTVGAGNINTTDDPVVFMVVDGSQLGTPPCGLVLDGATANREVVKMTARGGNVVTAERLVEPGAVKLAHTGAYTVEAIAPAFGLRAHSDTLARQRYDVMNYGAVGDGVTDDAPVVRDLILLCFSQGGGTIFFPRGTYALSQIRLPVNMAGLVLQGESAEGTIIQHKGAGYLFDLSYLNRGGVRDMQLRANPSTDVLINLSGSSNTQLQRLKLIAFSGAYGTMALGNNVLTASSAVFTAGQDEGRGILVMGAGGVNTPLTSIIVAVLSPTQATLGNNALAAVAGGPDNTILWRPIGIRLYGSPDPNPDYPGYNYGGSYFNTVEDSRIESCETGIHIESSSGRKVAMNHFRQVSVTSATNQGAQTALSVNQSTANLFEAVDMEQCRTGIRYNDNCLDDVWLHCWNQGSVFPIEFVTSDHQFAVIGGQWVNPNTYAVNPQIVWVGMGRIGIAGKLVPNLGDISRALSFNRSLTGVGSIANGSFFTQTFTDCTGAQPTNPVLIAPGTIPATGVHYTAICTAANTVRVVVHNNSGGASDPSGGTGTIALQLHVVAT